MKGLDPFAARCCTCNVCMSCPVGDGSEGDLRSLPFSLAYQLEDYEIDLAMAAPATQSTRVSVTYTATGLRVILQVPLNNGVGYILEFRLDLYLSTSR